MAVVPGPVDRFFELSLLGLVTSGYLAVVGSGYLDAPTTVLVALGLLVRALIVSGLVRLHISNRTVAGATLAYIAFYPLDYLFVSGEFVPATVHLVFFLAVLKILTAHEARDHVFVAVIAFLELLAASILSYNVSFFGFLALFLLFGVATFASGEIRRSIRRPRNLARAGLRRFSWRLAALSASAALGILLMTAGMFFLLPRTARAAFQHLVPERYHVPGFSNEMRLGEIGEIQQLRTPVMHVKMQTRNPGLQLKWRGNALTQFDGRRWFNPAEPGQILRAKGGLVQVASDNQRRRRGQRINYEVRLSSIASDNLFFAGTPEFLQTTLPAVVRSSSGSLRAGFGQTENLRYGVYAFLEDTAEPAEPNPAELRESDRIANLLLPPIDPRIIALAQKLTAGLTSQEAKARAIENWLRKNFGYTTELLPRAVPDPLAYFLFERRKGHCEYFSSAMTVMLRAVNVPARVTNGFQSGVYNPLSGWYLVRASDAHSWVEAWVPGRGWTSFDPTPPSPESRGYGLAGRLSLYLDAAETFWHEWVLSYDLDRQITLASRMEDSGRSFSAQWLAGVRGRVRAWRAGAVDGAKQYGALVVAALALAILVGFYAPRAWRWCATLARVRKAQRGAAVASDATLLYERMLAALHRRGYQKPPWTTPREFAGQVRGAEAAALVTDFTAAYHDLRYGGNASAAPRMVALLERIERY